VADHWADLTEEQLREMAKSMSTKDLSEKYRVGIKSVQVRLRKYGLLAARWCKQCGCNRRPEDFKSATHRNCRIHPPINKSPKHTLSLNQREKEEGRELAALVSKLNAVWTATGDRWNRYQDITEHQEQ